MNQVFTQWLIVASAIAACLVVILLSRYVRRRRARVAVTESSPQAAPDPRTQEAVIGRFDGDVARAKRLYRNNARTDDDEPVHRIADLVTQIMLRALSEYNELERDLEALKRGDPDIGNFHRLFDAERQTNIDVARLARAGKAREELYRKSLRYRGEIIRRGGACLHELWALAMQGDAASLAETLRTMEAVGQVDPRGAIQELYLRIARQLYLDEHVGREPHLLPVPESDDPPSGNRLAVFSPKTRRFIDGGREASPERTGEGEHE